MANRSSGRRRTIVALGAAAAVLLTTTGGPARSAPAPVGLAEPPPAMDPQSWVLPQDMTWDDYKPIPGFDWASNAALQAPKPIRAALILGDYEDQPMIMTMPDKSDLAGNPQSDGGVPQEEVAQWWADFLNKPQLVNRGHTMNEYWLENSYGLVGVDVEGFGPYRMAGKSFEYGLGGSDAGGGGDACPAEHTCGRNFDAELVEKSAADVTTGVARNGEDYDFRYLLSSGYDESGTWQEFGEMKFQDENSVSDAFGPPDESLPNSASTRYVPWTSWWSSKGIWAHAIPGALSTQSESDGASVFAHELSHILGVLDNYNNPYGDPVRRAYSGPWDMLSRGTFNGPGGNHQRWLIPPTKGASMGSHHMLRNKLRMGFLRPGEVLPLDRTALQASGPVITDVWTREIPLGPDRGRTGLHGIQIRLLGGDRSPPCTIADDYRCDGGGYTAYTLEVVDRMGTDSFLPDHGVILAKTKDVDTAPFIWVVDAHPEDADLVDFIRPNGTVAKVSLGDYRQIMDAAFHAGTGPGVVSEYVDEPNGLHFYVLDIARDEEGVLSYRVAVRATAGSRPITRAVSVGATTAADVASPGYFASCAFDVVNDSADVDLVRFVATSDKGWPVTVRRNVGDVAAGDTEEVPVHVKVPLGTAPGTVSTITLTATSETSSTATGDATCAVRAAAGAAAPVQPPAKPPGTVKPPTPPGTPLPATGADDLMAILALGLVASAVAVRRRVRA
ncbi:MAG TPA: peptidase M6 [Mycobacteriales bacterium]|nr:peptidase M6 [Mycobacteriales bacterium]